MPLRSPELMSGAAVGEKLTRSHRTKRTARQYHLGATAPGCSAANQKTDDRRLRCCDVAETIRQQGEGGAVLLPTRVGASWYGKAGLSLVGCGFQRCHSVVAPQ